MILKIKVNFANMPSMDDVKRQAEWRERSVQKIKASRLSRLKLLDRDRAAIDRAVQAYSNIDLGEVPSILLRDGFIALNVPRQLESDDDEEYEEQQERSSAARARMRARDLATRPPLTRVVHRQSKALALYLTAVYIAQVTTKAGRAFKNDRPNARSARDGRRGWILLGGMTTAKSDHARRARIRRALDELEVAELVGLEPPRSRNRYERWKLLSEDGGGSHYRIPSERDTAAVALPAAFFFNGWHLVLTSGEIAMLLVIMHRFRMGRSVMDSDGLTWISLPRGVRAGTYGVSGEMYLHAQQLVEFGLVEFRDPMPKRRRGKIPVKKAAFILKDDEDGASAKENEEPPKPLPYLFRPSQPSVFDSSAFKVVHETLSMLEIPYRLDGEGALVTPQDLVKAYRDAE